MKPIFPVAQNLQPNLQPAWDDMQTVRRSRSVSRSCLSSLISTVCIFTLSFVRVIIFFVPSGSVRISIISRFDI